ncbi:3906_t:CDS:2, partial [Gigaspora margarita]
MVNAASSFKEHALNWNFGLKRRQNSFSISESILLLTNFIFERELRSIAVNKNNDLSFFFDQIEDMACLGSDYFSWVNEVNVLFKFLYDHEKVEQKLAIYSFKQLHKEIVAKDISR